METGFVNSTILERNSFLVHPFVPEPGAQNQCTFPPHFRLPQFSEVSSLILSRMKGNSTEPQTTLGQLSTSKADDASADELTLFLPGDFSNSAATGVKYVYDNDDSFETVGIDFSQESIPFRAPYEPIDENDTPAEAPEVSREEAIEAQRKSWLDALPEGVQPAKPELVGFPAGTEASASALTTYFSNKPKTDLLNILSFCDQLEPQLLVDVFVSVAKRHPGLPIFDSPDWEKKVREQEAANAAALDVAQARARAHQRPRHGHTLLNPRMRQRRKGVRKVVIKFTTTATTESAGKTVVVQEEETEDEEVLPPTWPRAGEGLYATLPPEDKDTLYLADEGDDEAFSHFLVDGLGNLTALAACG
ncbi:hypothetical protein ISF_02164 [Cordyceps fumosorosea ARSEF 2679]|uniref:Uncharacterized protein n=1 Tax=Cordyceps fumosorosea (strain ARSEF 2679) TaxID=1081104 RepID=A0A168CP17_CORFA|nr:hypothetical protein ISF_02164 [Cordyceps fumosorosea ARSEF 2679]OAA71613.1 hypothetical protein ISF_02164 [Cordyceps fumosorosea ARSEF 2679]